MSHKSYGFYSNIFTNKKNTLVSWLALLVVVSQGARTPYK